MSEDTNSGSEQQQPADEGAKPEGGDEFTPITSQDDLNRIIQQRVSRVEQKYSDYDQLKSQAAEYQQLQDQNKTELQREQDARARLEQENNDLRVGQLRFRIAGEKGVPVELLGGTTEKEIAAAADKLLDFAKGANAPRPPKPNPKQGQGGDSSIQGDWLREQLTR